MNGRKYPLRISCLYKCGLNGDIIQKTLKDKIKVPNSKQKKKTKKFHVLQLTYINLGVCALDPVHKIYSGYTKIENRAI